MPINQATIEELLAADAPSGDDSTQERETLQQLKQHLSNFAVTPITTHNMHAALAPDSGDDNDSTGSDEPVPGGPADLPSPAASASPPPMARKPKAGEQRR